MIELEMATSPVRSASAATTAFAGASLAIFGSLTVNDIVGVIGAFVGIGGFIVMWYYKHQQHKLFKKKLDLMTLKELRDADG